MEKVNVKPVEEQIKDLNDVIQRNLDASEDFSVDEVRIEGE